MSIFKYAKDYGLGRPRVAEKPVEGVVRSWSVLAVRLICGSF